MSWYPWWHNELNAVKLHEIDFFVSLLEDIRNHFLISESTQLVYVTIAEHFFHHFDPTLWGNLKRLTQRDFYDYIFYKWSTFNSYWAPCTLGGIDWGWVGKGGHKPNEINISSDVVVSVAVSLTFSTLMKTNLDIDMGSSPPPSSWSLQAEHCCDYSTWDVSCIH